MASKTIKNRGHLDLGDPSVRPHRRTQGAEGQLHPKSEFLTIFLRFCPQSFIISAPKNVENFQKSKILAKNRKL